MAAAKRGSMTLYSYIWLTICIVGIVVGQILLKYAVTRNVGGALQLIMSPVLLGALTVYGLAMIAWLLTLRQVDLSRAYPFVAISFVLVPFLSSKLLGEVVPGKYWLGVVLIVLGVAVTSRV